MANKFSYDSAGNRVASQHNDEPQKIYNHTTDNQLTEMSWGNDKTTLKGEIQNCWTAKWIKVERKGMYFFQMFADFKCERGKPVKWQAEVPAFGAQNITYIITAETPDGQTISQSVTYPRTTNLSNTIIYQYDNRGNRTRKTDKNNKITTYTYDDENQLTDINGYDKNGNHFVYIYKYDPFGRRIKAKEDGISRYFAFDGLDNIAEMKIANSKLQIEKYSTCGSGLGGGIGDIIALTTENGIPNTEYFSYNHRGDVVLTTDEYGNKVAEYEYDAFGTPITDGIAE